MIQYIFAIGITDITDLITNTSGGLFGLMIYGLSSKFVAHEKLDTFIGVTGAMVLIAFTLSLGVLRSHGVRFQPASPPGMHRLRRELPRI
jgi:glycopeptide antibiotics resistance protein